MKVTRTVNGTPVGDGDIAKHRIANSLVIRTLYSALWRAG